MMLLVLSLILSAHLLAVNIAAGAPFWVVFCERGYCRNRDLALRSGRYLSIAAVVMLLVGLLLGLVLFAWHWNSPGYTAAVTRLQYKLVWGAAELAFSLVLGCLSIWMWSESIHSLPTPPWKRWIRGGISLLNATNLLYHFPLLFLVLRHLVNDPGTEPITAPLFRSLIVQSPIPELAVHVVLASLAMGGLALLGLALRLRREGDSPEQLLLADRAAIWGARAALVPSLLQIPVGLWLLMNLGTSAQSKLMGGHLIASLMFLTGLATALWLLHILAMIASGQTDRRTLLMSMGTATATVVFMTVSWQLATR